MGGRPHGTTTMSQFDEHFLALASSEWVAFGRADV
jgi:hypothetical protein